MKIVLIIYAISWLILLAIYVSDKLHKRTDSESKETWGFKLFFMFVLILLAPIVVLVIPCILIYDFYRIKKLERTQKKEIKVLKDLCNN